MSKKNKPKKVCMPTVKTSATKTSAMAACKHMIMPTPMPSEGASGVVLEAMPSALPNVHHPSYGVIDTGVLPPVALRIKPIGRPDGSHVWGIVAETEGESGTISTYPTYTLAQADLRKYTKRLTERTKAVKRECREVTRLKPDRRSIQLYLMSLSADRCIIFLESLKTFNALIHMLAYEMDAAEEVWDGLISPEIRKRWSLVKRNLEAMLQELYITREGKDEENGYDGYNRMAVRAQRILDTVNAMVNYGGDLDGMEINLEGDWRLTEVERAVSRVLPTEVLDHERQLRIDQLHETLIEKFGPLTMTVEQIEEQLKDKVLCE